MYETASTGLPTPEIEEARQAAWVAISALAKTLKEEGFAGPTLWSSAQSDRDLDRIVDLRSRCPRSERSLQPNVTVTATLWYAKINMDLSKGNRWFCSVQEAEAAGCRPPKN